MDSDTLLRLLVPARDMLPLIEDPRLPETWKRTTDLPPAARALAEFIDGEPDLAIFRDGFFALGGMGLVASPYMVGSWLIQRAVMTSAHQAVDDLQKYLSATHLPCKLRTIITGMSSQAFELEPGLRFTPWGFLPKQEIDNETYDRLRHQQWRVLPTSEFVWFVHAQGLRVWPPTGIVDKEIQVRRPHVSSGQVPAREDGSIFDPHEAVLALQLVSHCPVWAASTWIDVPDWCPLHFMPARTLNGSGDCPISGDVPLTTVERQTVTKLLAGYRQLPIKVRRGVRLATERLTEALSHGRGRLASRAVDLRVALEAALVLGESDDPKYRGELRFRFALRAAKYLASQADFETRKQIFRSTRDLYDLGSSAVHGGDLDHEDMEATLTRGAEIIRQSLRETLIRGKAPDWFDESLR